MIVHAQDANACWIAHTFPMLAGLYCNRESQLNDSPSHCYSYRLRTILGLELLHYMFDVHLDRFLGNEQPFCDIAIAVTSRDMAEDLDLPVGQSLIAEMLDKLRDDFGRDSFLTGMNVPDRIRQFVGGHAFDQIPAGTCIESPLNFDVTFKCRQYQVHESYVWPMRPKQPDSIVGVSGGGHQHHIRLATDDCANPFAH